MKRKALFSILVISFLSFYACDASVNSSKHLGDGEHSAGMNSVNGSIHVGSRCRVDGNCHTVNGSIEVGDDSRVLNLETVNGRIRVGTNVEVDGDAETVNGSFVSAAGSKIHGKVSTVNGRIELRGTVVDEEVGTVNGDVLLREKAWCVATSSSGASAASFPAASV